MLTGSSARRLRRGHANLLGGRAWNYVHIGSEVGVSHKVVRNDFDILEDTFLCTRLSPWRKSQSRRMILTVEFHLFDVGVANHPSRRRPMPGNPDFGKSFEHFIFME